MSEDFAIPLAGIMMPVFLVPAIMGMRQVAKRREFEHLERMKALELRRSLPGGDAWTAAMAIAIGAVVPLGSMIVAWLASLTTTSVSGPWESAAGVGVTSTICGFILGWRHIGARSTVKKDEQSHVLNGKPVHDPDAYDVVGRRG